MSREYLLDDEAVDDLNEIWQYGARTYGFDQADAYDDGFHATFERLCVMPELGRSVPDREDGVRALIDGSHIVVYRPTPAPLLVVRVLHQRRDWVGVVLKGLPSTS